MRGTLAGVSVALTLLLAWWVTEPLWHEQAARRVRQGLCRVLGHRYVITWLAYAVLYRCARCGARR